MPDKRKSTPRRTYGIITALVFVVLTVYLCGNLINFLNHQDTVAVESVQVGSLDLPASFQGLIIRDEQIYRSGATGIVSYNYADGDHLKKGATVCLIRLDDSAAQVQEQLAAVDKSLLSQQREREDISAHKNDITAVEKKMADLIYSYNGRFNNGKLEGLYGFRSQLETQIERRNRLWTLDSQNADAQLSAEKARYEEQLSGGSTAMTSESSGTLSLNLDGCEETYTPDNRTAVTEADTKTRVEVQRVLSTSGAVTEGDALYKVIRSNTWYVVGYVENDKASAWKAGDTVTLTGDVGEEEETVRMTVDSVSLGDEKAQVIFRSARQMSDFLTERTLTFTVRGDTYEGLKVPNTAIVEKALLKIPKACLQEGASGYQVIRRVQGTDTLISVNVLKSDDQAAYVLQDYENLKLGDVLLSGSGQAATEVTLSEVSNYQGVYVVNSSVAAFTVVEILAQNTDYAIVKPATLSSGLQVYDNIVSDASSVQEGDQIY